MSKLKQARTNNDDRADSKNPNNTAHKAAKDNTANQKNPNHSKTKK